jgi:transcription-repair coupling factor (superfamily II helicase)
VLIPENYVPDLGVRLGLYRRIAGLTDRREIDGFAAELIDRFGTLPAEVENLLEIIAIKRYCREAGIEKLEAGPKAPSSHCETIVSPTGRSRRADPAQRRHPEAPLRPKDPLSAQLGRRQSPPNRRHQTGTSPRQNRPRRQTRR